MVPDTIWWHGRFVWLALTLVARDGPNEDVFTQLERSRERLLAAGDPQWVAEAGLGAAALLVAGRYDEALVAAESGREGITIGHYGLLARISAPLLSAALAHADSETVDRWSHAVLDREDAVWAQPAARAFARGILARRAGDADGAIGHYEEAATLAEAQRGLWRWTMTYALLGLAEIHAAARRTHDAGEAFDRAVAKWRWARATWYVAELERWAAERGIPVAGA
jgi:tetratricopeptide (TPR) repeat protein